MRFWPRRKTDQDDLYRPLSAQEEELVEHGVDLDIPLSEGEREQAQREVNEQLGHDAPE
jgi:hypothetical protein